jgi:hypothetical protein
MICQNSQERCGLDRGCDASRVWLPRIQPQTPPVAASYPADRRFGYGPTTPPRPLLRRRGAIYRRPWTRQRSERRWRWGRGYADGRGSCPDCTAPPSRPGKFLGFIVNQHPKSQKLTRIGRSFTMERALSRQPYLAFPDPSFFQGSTHESF